MRINTMRFSRRAAASTLLVLAGVCVSAVVAKAQSSFKPDFGANVHVFNPSMPMADIQKQIDAAYAVEIHNEFGPQRYAFLFSPGEYKLDLPIGFYTEVIGLGASPDKVHITGNVRVDAASRNDNATTTFWRSAEGFSVTPTGGDIPGTMKWAVSQAVAFRRMHVYGNLVLNQKRGWASGGWMADSLIDGTVDSGTQQQWISRNSEWKNWTGANWNMVFVGVPQVPAGEWPEPPFTKIAKTPVAREKPFLEIDEEGRYGVRLPELLKESEGITWHNSSTPGKFIPLDRFYIAQAGRDTAATINAQLAKGKHLLISPGVYELTEPIQVTKPGTIVMGLGFATLKPVNGTATITTADADGIVIAGLLFDAGVKQSPVLLEVGPTGSGANHTKDPIALYDVFFRVGGTGPASVAANLVINSHDTIVDHTWIWRADHGKGAGWGTNPSANGLIVNGNNVTIYGLFVEHHQQFQVLWKGNHGRTYFYQSEIPYDPPTQPEYTSAPGTNGWASYKVADGVTDHEAWGLGMYSVFRHDNVNLTRAIEVPKAPGVRFHHMITVALDDKGEISNVINDAGGPTHVAPGRVTPKLTDYPATK